MFLPSTVLEECGVAPKVIERYTSILHIFGPSEGIVRNSWGKANSSWVARTGGWEAYYLKGKTTFFLGQGVGSISLCVDSTYVRKFVESGMIGLLSFFSILYCLCRSSSRYMKKTKNGFHKSICIGYLGGVAGFLVHSICVSNFSTISTAEMFWIFSGLMVATSNIKVETVSTK